MKPRSFLADDAGEVCEYRASDGRRLKYRHWRAPGPLCASIVALHGIQSHSGWYGYSSRALAEAGIEVRFLDRRGSGLNPQERGHATSAARLMEDVADLIRAIDTARREKAAGKVPQILLGLSWGARLAAAVCDRHPDLFDGLILLYPGIHTRVRPSAVQRGLMWLAHLGGGRRLPIPIPLRPEQFTSEPRRQAFVRDDPLAVRRASVGLLVAGEELSHLAVRALERLALPRLVMLAGQDEIVDLAQTRATLSCSPAGSLRVVEYPSARHTLEFEPDRERFVTDLIHWIKSIRSPS